MSYYDRRDLYEEIAEAAGVGRPEAKRHVMTAAYTGGPRAWETKLWEQTVFRLHAAEHHLHWLREEMEAKGYVYNDTTDSWEAPNGIS